jgi:hypothetical protein
MLVRMRRLVMTVAVTLSVLASLIQNPKVAYGQSTASPGTAESGTSTSAQAKLKEARRSHEIYLDQESGISIGVEGYSGISVLAASEKRRGHVVTGGLLRARVGRFELGGHVDESDYADGKWRSIGGFLGLYTPFVNWVDVDCSAGIAYRRYEIHELRYGKNGAIATVPSLTFRLGISERSGRSLFALRLGAAAFAQVDVATKDIPWEYVWNDRVIASGTTNVGGTSVGIMINFGFDLAFRSAPRQ